MYRFIKVLVKKIVPHKFLFQNEPLFRQFLVPVYKGSSYQCNICGKKWRKFISLPGGNDLLCPYCGSRSRTRRLSRLLKERNALRGNVLHFSPSRSLYRLFGQPSEFVYFSTDFEDEFLADHRIDITAIDFPSEKFDTIICYHILEHIIEDKQAMGELFRVLKNDGYVLCRHPTKKAKFTKIIPSPTKPGD